MKKTQWWKLLLFSFFLVLLLSSCAEDTPLLQELAQHGEWDALYHAAKKTSVKPIVVEASII